MKYEKMEFYNPTQIITQIHKQKLKTSIIPIFMVIASFSIHIYVDFQWTQHISLVGLIGYFLINMLFKVNRKLLFSTPKPTLVFPISGKIETINFNQIIISKKPFETADIRFAGIHFSLDSIEGKTYIFNKEETVAGKLIGVAPFSAKCTLEIPDNLEINFKVGEKVIAGDEII